MYHAGLCLPTYQLARVNEQSKLCPCDAYISEEEKANKQTDYYDMVISAMKNHKQG